VVKLPPKESREVVIQTLPEMNNQKVQTSEQKFVEEKHIQCQATLETEKSVEEPSHKLINEESCTTIKNPNHSTMNLKSRNRAALSN